MMATNCSRLRSLAQNCLSSGLLPSACFFGDKLVSLSGVEEDTYLLAQCYFASKQYRRALALLSNDGGGVGEGRAASPPLFRCLMAKCMVECGEWEECLALLGDEEAEDDDDDGLWQPNMRSQRQGGDMRHADEQGGCPREGAAISPAATLCLLRGRAFEACQNRTRAVVWYKHALSRDAYCYDAFSALIDGHMLTNEEEVELVEGLHFAEHDEWVKKLYRCKCKKGVVEALLKELEAPGPLSTWGGDALHTRGTQPLQQQGRRKDSVVTSLRYTPLTQNAPHQQQQQRAGSGVNGLGVNQRGGGASPAMWHSIPPAQQQQPGSATAGMAPTFGGFGGFGSPMGTPMAISPSPLLAIAVGARQQQQLEPGQMLSSLPPVGTTAEKTGSGVYGADGGRQSERPSPSGTDDMMMDEETATPMPSNAFPSDGGGNRMEQSNVKASVPVSAQRQLQQLDGGGILSCSATEGCGLAGNADVMMCRADLLFTRGSYEKCYAVTSSLLQRDPYALQALPLHLGAALRLGKKNDLFIRGHRLVEEHPEAAISWYAVACYYMCTRQYEQARRYFGKVTTMDAGFALAWIGYGHAFAAQDERDQAMAAYRTAARLFPGLHTPLLGMGMEYSGMNNLQLAERMLLTAHRLCPTDPATSHELGVLNYKNGQHSAAAMWLRSALEKLPCGGDCAAGEPSLVALGHCMRKQRQYVQALEWYHRGLAVNPAQASTHSAIGLVHQLMGDAVQAVEAYHAALALRPDDALAGEMLARALQDFAGID